MRKHIACKCSGTQCQAILSFNSLDEAIKFIEEKNVEIQSTPLDCWRYGGESYDF